ITSVAAMNAPAGERTIALGYIRRETGIPGREVMIGAVRATVTQLPFTGATLQQAEDAVLHKV
ncbi:MAG: hypothetical protein WAN65_05500, partial [Candidatus Sulfotelmatobacter sp.]